MRTRVAVVGAAIALFLPAASSAAPQLTAPRFVPNAIAFRDRLHGVLGSGWESCANAAWRCRLAGAIFVTSDGGRTWTAVRDTPRPVVALIRDGNAYVATLDDGEQLRSARGGRAWKPAPSNTAGINTTWSVCPQGMLVGANSGAFDWSLCTTEAGAGNQGKAVYRQTTHGWKIVACTPFANLGGCAGHGSGGISSYGYPLGIAGNDDGFALIWESRGTLYVTRDGGKHWSGLSKLVRPDVDFGTWAFVLPKAGVGWEVVAYGGTEKRRLIETTDAGRTWHVVHRWLCTVKRQRCGDVSGPP